MIREIENARPKYLVSVLMNDSWLYRPQSTLGSLHGQIGTPENYAVAGLVNIRPAETDYFFEDVPASVESLKDYILIYGRKP